MNPVKRSVVYILAAVAAVVAIAAIFSVYSFGGVSNRTSSPNNEIENTVSRSRLSLQTLQSDGSPIQGDVSAPVTLVEFGDFQCEFCARFAKDTEPQIYQNYIQTGKINMAFKHLVHYGSDSTLAAAGSQCANDQGKFWDYYHVLYANQDSFMLSQDSNSALKNLASKIDGLDIQKFSLCLSAGTYKDVAQKDTAQAASLGYHDTPTFLIMKNDGSNPQTIVGAYPFGTFKTLLDKEIGAS
jgi:protein-disulfide isomerase